MVCMKMVWEDILSQPSLLQIASVPLHAFDLGQKKLSFGKVKIM